ncbi:MAG: hypothetical protein V1755_14080 [Chloroflexota bacterium]
MPDLISYQSIADVPIHYDRLSPPYHYATRGKGPRTVRSTPEFRDRLADWIDHLAAVCPMGRPEILVTAGFQVDKGSARNTHRRGIAFDLDGLWWPDGERIFAQASNPIRFPRYLAIEAGLRMHFGWVRGRWADPKHDDHWHCDMSMPVGFAPRSPRCIRFVQAALKYVLPGPPVVQDGKWGRETDFAMVEALLAAGHTPVVLADFWQEFLELVERTGWAAG